MQGLWTVLLLIVSNVFMTLAWYGHLKLSEMHISDIALLEYLVMVPANRIGSRINGGPFSLVQLKVIQEAISLTVFTIMVILLFKGESLQWNHFVAFALIILAVFFCFLK